MMRFHLACLACLAFFAALSEPAPYNVSADDLALDYETAANLAELPFKCITQEYPYKHATVWNSASEVQTPCQKHPIFCGCLDWHSSAHGHWLLAAVMNRFPNTSLAERAADLFDQQFQEAKVATETAVFSTPYNDNFERTYGWAWLVKLQQELLRSPLDSQRGWSATLQPLVDTVLRGYKKFLPSLVYPVRVGEHPNTAFGLIFAYEYAKDAGNLLLEKEISAKSRHFFTDDQNCPLAWEPSGYDFLSPCFQEADLMGRVSKSPADYKKWLQKLLPNLLGVDFQLKPGTVQDEADGKLVHLYGVNFSRAWNIYSVILNLGEEISDDVSRHLMSLADEHVRASMGKVVDSHYSGSHWLASFMLYALQKREEALAAESN